MAVKRIYLKDLHQMLDGMNIELAEKVHLLFMNNYISYSNYGFKDEWQVDEYMSVYTGASPCAKVCCPFRALLKTGTVFVGACPYARIDCPFRALVDANECIGLFYCWR